MSSAKPTGSSAHISDEEDCFARGTRIRTPDGDQVVEALRQGDLVRLADGSTARIVYVGRRRVDLARHKDRRRVQPVRIAADAFGPGLPYRDLLLSPEHAVFWDGVLIPVRRLAGCRGISAEDRLDCVEYFHVELTHHDVLLAEGLPCESWLETGDRWMFSNGPVTAAVFSERVASVGPWASLTCAPIVESGPELEAVRHHLNDPVRRPGWDDFGNLRPARPMEDVELPVRLVLPAESARLWPGADPALDQYSN